MYKLYLLAVIVLILLGGFISFHSNDKYSPSPLPLEERVDSLLALMNLEEKIGQLVLFTSDIDVTGPTIREGYKEDIKSGAVGALFNAYGADYTRELQKIAVEETRLGIPLLFGYDVIHGHKTIFPISLGEAASWDLEAIEMAARIAAVEASAEGLHWTFAPMVDISRDPRWGRVSEGAGEDPYLGSAIARARVKGYQGEDLSATNTILATVKHFAAYGASLAGRDYNTVDISERELRQTYLPPYKAALDAGAATVMTSFNELDGIPVTGSKYLMTDILRQEWGFGLSYSSFTYQDLALDKENYQMDETIHIQVSVRNDSQRAGEEVVQLYIRDLVGSVTRPVKELKGFQKIQFEPGEEKVIKFQLNKDHLAFYTANMEFQTEPGEFEIYVGTNSSENLKGQFTLLNGKGD